MITTSWQPFHRPFLHCPSALLHCPSLQSDKAFLVALKAAQQGARLADDEASSLVKEAARARVEGLLDVAVKCIKQRSRVRDYTGACTGV